MITAIREGSRRIIAAVDDAARALGLRPGQTVAHAQALVPDLTIVPARPEADAAALARLAAWCLRYAPIVAPDPPDGIFIDIAGAAHLRGGEHKLLDDLVARLNRAGITVQASVADTPATAWAVARYGSDRVVPPGRMADAIASLPIQALRLSADTVASLREVGIERVAQLAAKSPGSLKLRFGPEILIRLDQALGHEPDLFEPLLPPDIPQCKRAFAEPIGDPEDLKRVVGDLTAALCRDLEQSGVGARRLDPDLPPRRSVQPGRVYRHGRALARSPSPRAHADRAPQSRRSGLRDRGSGPACAAGATAWGAPARGRAARA